MIVTPLQADLSPFTFDCSHEQSNLAQQNHIILHTMTIFCRLCREYSDKDIDHHLISSETLLLQFGSGVRDTRLISTNLIQVLVWKWPITSHASLLKSIFTHPLLQTWSFGPFWSFGLVSSLFSSFHYLNIFVFIGQFHILHIFSV